MEWREYIQLNYIFIIFKIYYYKDYWRCLCKNNDAYTNFLALNYIMCHKPPLGQYQQLNTRYYVLFLALRFNGYYT